MATATPGYVRTCVEVDPSTSACTAEAWLPPASSGLPSLTIAQAQQIGVSIALLWAVAWGIKMAKKLLDNLN